MPRTAITVQTLSAYGGKIQDISYTAADAANNMVFTHPGRSPVLLLVKNKHSSQQDVVVKGVASRATRNVATDITIATAAGNVADKESLHSIDPGAVLQSDGTVNIDIADATALTLAVVEFEPNP